MCAVLVTLGRLGFRGLSRVRAARRSTTRVGLGVGGLLGLVATATLAFAGHAAAGDSLRRSADMLHLTLAAIWLGGLLPLAALLRAASRNASARALPDARVVTARFSNL